MSTIKSSAENLTLNADGSGNDIKFQSNGVEVGSLTDAGVLTATTFTGAATDTTKLPLAGGNMTGKLVVNGTNTASVTDAATLAASQVLSVNSNSGEGSDNLMLGAMSDGTGDQFIEATNGGGAATYKIHLNPINNGTVVLGGGVAIGGTGTANTLDDYEEGTFTATLTGSSANPSTAVTTTGYYTKIGNVVQIAISFENKTTSGASGNVRVTGLPFTNHNQATRYPLVCSLYKGFTWGNDWIPSAIIPDGNDFIYFYQNSSQTTWEPINHNATTAVHLWISGTYRTAS